MKKKETVFAFAFIRDCIYICIYIYMYRGAGIPYDIPSMLRIYTVYIIVCIAWYIVFRLVFMLVIAWY